MIKNLFAIYDSVTGSTLTILDSENTIEQFVTKKKREMMFQPNPVFEDAEIHFVGTYDDETLEGKWVLHQKVGDFKDEFLKLRALAAARHQSDATADNAKGGDGNVSA